MPESPIRKLVPYAENAKKKGHKVYHLNIGQPDIATPQIALEAVKAADLKTVEYSHSAGIESYRVKLAEYYNENYKAGIDIDNIIVTAGASEAIVFSFLVCLNPGDEIIIPEPYYANYKGFTTHVGVNISPVTSTIDTGFALPSVADIEKSITDKTKAILICNPNNPTGYIYSKEEMDEICAIVKKYNLFLMSDEVYREFVYDGYGFTSALDYPEIQDNVIVFDSTSKRFSACGIRVGMMVSRNKELISTALKFAQSRLSPPTYGQIAAEAALSTDKEYFEEVYDEYVARRDYLVANINKIEGVKCPMPKGAFYCIAELPVDDAEKFCVWILDQFEHEGGTVMMAPAAGFYTNVEYGKKQVRIAYVLNQQDLEKSIQILDAALKAYPGREL